MYKIRKPAVAGSFYPKDVLELKSMLEFFFAKAKGKNEPVPKAIIAPHAGYIFSGQITASAYAVLVKAQKQIKRVVVMAPAHHYLVPGFAIPSDDIFATPLGEIIVDKVTLQKIYLPPKISFLDEAFGQEHAVEAHLPFLQTVLSDFILVPILVGLTNLNEVVAVLDSVWGGDETLIVVSSDLSHYFEQQEANELDKKTIASILALDYAAISPEQACGYVPVKGLLKIIKQKGLTAKLIDNGNSGDASVGGKDHVVGYGAFHFGIGK